MLKKSTVPYSNFHTHFDQIHAEINNTPATLVMNSETTFRRFPCNTSTISTWSYPHIPSITFCLTSIILFLNNRYHIHFHFNTLLKPTSRASFHSNSYLMATPHSSTHASNTTYCTYNAKHYSMFLWLLIQLRMIIKPSYKNLSPTHSKCSCITKWLLGLQHPQIPLQNIPLHTTMSTSR